MAERFARRSQPRKPSCKRSDHETAIAGGLFACRRFETGVDLYHCRVAVSSAFNACQQLLDRNVAAQREGRPAIFHPGHQSRSIIAAPEVEAVLAEHPAVQECAVVASPDPTRGFVPKAYVVPRQEAKPGTELVKELQDFTKGRLAPYKYPRRVEFVASLPKTETGKIRRVELRKKEMEVLQQQERAFGRFHNCCIARA